MRLARVRWNLGLLAYHQIFGHRELLCKGARVEIADDGAWCVSW
jgi:hypothetical protein